ncbi:MAG: hypothetical protein KBA26_01365 [Candidatus Delongbacteria bacterium]|nr:hypothetical protein [Candidatus Delongbacteria bacterium]
MDSWRLLFVILMAVQILNADQGYLPNVRFYKNQFSDSSVTDFDSTQVLCPQTRFRITKYKGLVLGGIGGIVFAALTEKDDDLNSSGEPHLKINKSGLFKISLGCLIGLGLGWGIESSQLKTQRNHDIKQFLDTMLDTGYGVWIGNPEARLSLYGDDKGNSIKIPFAQIVGECCDSCFYVSRDGETIQIGTHPDRIMSVLDNLSMDMKSLTIESGEDRSCIRIMSYPAEFVAVSKHGDSGLNKLRSLYYTYLFDYYKAHRDFDFSHGGGPFH